MPLTKDFKTTIMARAHRDKAFCNAMLTEAINEFFTGDLDVGKAILRDYITPRAGIVTYIPHKLF